MQSKVVVITGGGQGIGRATAYAFADAGAQVVIAEIDVEAGDEAIREIRMRGGKAEFIPIDVAAEPQIEQLANDLFARHGRVDVLVNNAAISSNASIEHRLTAEWDHVLNVNLRAPYLMTKYLLPLFRQAGKAAIINVASTRAFMSEANTEPYSASKGGLIALTHSLAISLAQDSVRVNAISPGWIDVTGWQKLSVREQAELSHADHAQHPVGRVGKPEDVAQACLYLASEQAGFITGVNLTVDGGMTAKMIYV